MRIHLDNTGEEMDKPASIGPCQSLEERMGGATAERVIAGPLTPEFKAILEAPSPVDRREMDYFAQSGLGIAEYFKAAGAAAAPLASSPLHKSADFEEADAVLRDFQRNHDKKSLSEQLAPLVERACAKLSQENAELLRKAHAVLDISVISFFLGRAFA